MSSANEGDVKLMLFRDSAHEHSRVQIHSQANKQTKNNKLIALLLSYKTNLFLLCVDRSFFVTSPKFFVGLSHSSINCYYQFVNLDFINFVCKDKDNWVLN